MKIADKNKLYCIYCLLKKLSFLKKALSTGHYPPVYFILSSTIGTIMC